MTDRFLIDSNILVYAFTNINPKKQKKAKEIIYKARDSTLGYISKQNIIELINTNKKFSKNLSNKELQKIITGLESLKIIDYSTTTIKKALDIQTQTNIGFFDSLIIQTMIENNIFVIFTENEKDFKKTKNFSVINPFK
ncbi:MAG: PIN domain-containing protein [Candidatus ainarchaeum sp.]|nr:PIN domain-containing protein [Candidatus ainarchaeum sp.]